MGDVIKRASEQTAPTNTLNRRIDIQGMRAIAVLVVIAYHAGLPVPGGFVGVDVFFVISGFVISAMLLREQHATAQIDLKGFYKRRFKRLAPALAVMTTITLALSAIFLSPLGTQQTASSTAIGAMLFAANVVIAKTTGDYFDARAELNPLLHTWSLSVEEQFYLIFPLILILGWLLAQRRKSFQRMPYYLMGALLSISFAVALLGPTLAEFLRTNVAQIGSLSSVLESSVGFYSPITRSWEFAAGGILSLYLSTRKLSLSFPSKFVGFSGIILVGISLWAIDSTKPFPGIWTLLPVCGTLLLLAAGSGSSDPGAVIRALRSTVLVRVGDWSYSLYLWHWPLIVVAAAIWPNDRTALLLAAAVSAIPAIASYYWVENPIRQMERVRGRRLLGLVSITVAVPVVAALSLTFVTDRAFWSPKVFAMQNAVLEPHAMGPHCNAIYLTSPQTPAPCFSNRDGFGRPIYLVGDSTAWHFSEAAVGASLNLGRPLSMTNLPGCPFKDVYISSPDMPRDRDERACRTLYERSIKWIENQKPGTVVISQLNDTYRQPESSVGLSPFSLSSDPANRARALNQGLLRTIDTLRNAGHDVLLVQSAPDLRFPVEFNPIQCDLSQLRRGTCIGSVSRDSADELQQIERTSLEVIASESKSQLWDPRTFFCSSTECSSYRHSTNLYRDPVHITASASRLLAPSLTEALRTMQLRR